MSYLHCATLQEACAACSCKLVEAGSLQIGRWTRHPAEDDRHGQRSVSIQAFSQERGLVWNWRTDVHAVYGGKKTELVPAAVVHLPSGSGSIKQDQLLAAKQARTILSEGKEWETVPEIFKRKAITSLPSMPLFALTAPRLRDLGCKGIPLTGQLLVVVPIYGLEQGQLQVQSVQIIGSTFKHFLAKGKKKGGFWPTDFIGESPERIGVCEGVATALSVRELFQKEAGLTSVCAAFDAGNLIAVCKVLRQQWPIAEIVVFADNDRPLSDRRFDQISEGNVGARKGQKACRMVQGIFHMPVFYEESLRIYRLIHGDEKVPTDWNDWAQIVNQKRYKGVQCDEC